MELQPGQVVDRYRIEVKLAAGGMATVYRARHTKLNTLHAIKVLLVPAQHLMDRLIQEGQAQAALKHKNIVAVTDVIDVNGAPGLVMELIDGPSLHDLLGAQRLTLEQVDALARDIVRAVAHAHDHDMIHRDLKPANVMLAIERGELIPKVTDFGLAKLLTLPSGMEKTASGLAMGTPAYMAPEQFRDAKNVDERADVFSLGSILYEMVTGQRAFTGEQMITVYQSVSTGNFVDPSELVEDLPDRMANAIRKCLAVNPADRLESCDAILEVWCGTEITKPRRVPATDGPWNQSLLDRAHSLGSSGVQALVSPDNEEEPAGAAPTLDPGSAINSAETMYASLEPQTTPQTPQEMPGVGQTLTPPAPQQNLGRWIALGAVLLGVTLPATLLAGMWLGGSFESPEPVVAPAPEPAPVAAPQPEPEPAPEPVEAPEPAPQPAPVAAPTPKPKPKPAPAAAATGTVVVTGEGTVALQGSDGKRLPPGAVPAGTYQVFATFPGKTERKTGKIDVPTGETVTLKCSPQFNKCTVVH